MSKSVLIIGGSPAGMQAALELVESGIAVDLITASPFLNRTQPAAGIKNSENARLLSIARHPLIKLWAGTRVVRAEEGPQGISVGVHQQPRYVDLSKCTACGDCLEACPVTVAEHNHKAIFLPEGSQPGCAAIDKQGTAPCANACPGGIPVQGYVALIAQGRFSEAIQLIEEAIPFPGICGRICTHPCEINCRRNEVDAPVAIRALKRFVADWALEQPAEEKKIDPQARQTSRVAIVGSGPAGMTAALELIRRGYRTTVFEKLPVMAGMMSVGIPSYRLPRDVIENEYRRILGKGVDLRLNTTIGPNGDHSLDELFDMGFDAVCLAIGAHVGLKLNIPGEDLPGVVQGIEVLKLISLSQQLDDSVYQKALEKIAGNASSTRALVLGGGNTAMDVSRSLRRLGLEDVRIVYRRSREEMPAMPEEIADAEAEGVVIDFLTAPVEIIGDESRGVTGLKCIQMRLGEPDASGRRRPVPVENSEFLLEADLVVLAIGQTPDLAVDTDLSVNRRGRLQVNEPGYSTNRPGVFAAGDAVTHDRMAVIEAIGMGKQAAWEIDAYLSAHPEIPAQPVVRLPEILKNLTDKDRQPLERLAPSKMDAAKAVETFKEAELSFSADQAQAEAARCLSCGPCSECMACVKACKPGAVIHLEQPVKSWLQPRAVIDARNSAGENFELPNLIDHLQIIAPEDLKAASAAVADIKAILSSKSPAQFSNDSRPAGNGYARIGVFVCRCMDQISKTVDTAEICRQASNWRGVVAAHELDVSCSPEAAADIRLRIETEKLNQVVLAACSCCTIHQVCFSCTFQRVRCKQNLGVFPKSDPAESSVPFNIGDMGIGADKFEFVNIREQCAWVHTDNSIAATAKAIAMVEAAAAKSKLADSLQSETPTSAGGIAAEVDPDRCRTCYTCVSVCEINAVSVNGDSERPHAVVDPALCNGCGCCAARCPSNAIDIASATDAQIEAMITAMVK